MYYPTLEKFEKLSNGGNLIPVSREIFSDTQTPIGLFKRFAKEENSFLLESVEGGEKWARYSFIGREPYMVMECAKGEVVLHKGGTLTKLQGNPIYVLKDVLSEYKGVKVPGLPRFTGGVVGYFGYDIVRYFEDLPSTTVDDTGLPDCSLMYFNEIIAYDHLKQRILIIVNAHIKKDVADAYHKAVKRVGTLANELLEGIGSNGEEQNPLEDQKKEHHLNVESDFSREAFLKSVLDAKEYIKNGDIFQVVLSRRLTVETQIAPFNVYRVLRVLNPSPYMYYLNFKGFTVVGSSPELLVRVDNGKVETCPIAGTRPRGKTEDEDNKLADELLCDEKELAEHTMLVDLGRNDIGRVSRFGTVKVSNPMHIEKYSHVMHIVSNVEGQLREDMDCFDALTAVLPAGTLSGAPKVRAMEIIDELEHTKRGLYGGAVGYIGFDGTMDTCITIRTIVFKENKAFIQAGAGIVADSVPEKEYEETLNKAGALLKALQEAGDLQ